MLVARPLRLQPVILARSTAPRPASTARRSVRVPAQHLLLCNSAGVVRPAHIAGVSIGLRKISLFQIVAFRLQGPLWLEVSKSRRRLIGGQVGSVFFA